MDENTKVKYAEGVDVDLTNVNIESNPKDVNEIQKVTFETSKGPITWKPKVIKERRVAGIAIKDKVPMTIEGMPENLRKLGSMAYEKGTVHMIVNYSIMETEMDGQPKTYRFITSEKTLNDWKVVEDKPPVEKVE